MTGIVRSARRPAGWKPPGPLPRGDDGRHGLQPADDEDLCFLTGEWRLFQKQRGHRWSLDDLVTAWVAAEHASGSRRFLDLGCGLGSVLLMLAWRFPDADVTGIEAQADRAAMGRRSILWNGVEDRCRIVDGDLRAPGVDGPFGLITGTPPYFPIGTGPESDKTHAGPCRFEVRGGVEAYALAAERRLTRDGRFVVCTSALERARVTAAAKHAGLHVIEHLDVIPREGKDVLVNVDVLARAPLPRVDRSLVVRDAASRWTPQFLSLRAAMGMPPKP